MSVTDAAASRIFKVINYAEPRTFSRGPLDSSRIFFFVFYIERELFGIFFFFSKETRSTGLENN